jgi:hypothetical protein
MKTGIDQEFHLTYCSNIHPGESWAEVLANLKTYIPALKQRLANTSAFGIGLRLSDTATRELLEDDQLSWFQDWLQHENLYVFTLNGFPYGGFHHRVVKDRVYAPDWSKLERLEYTLRLTKILAAMLPAGMAGSISTLPLSYKPWWTDSIALETVYQSSTLHLTQLTATMVKLQQTTGKLLHIDLEPEPDGLIENTAEVIAFFQNWLLPVGGAWLANHLGISQLSAEVHLREHVRICYDTCHFAVEYESPQSVLAQLRANGIKIGKVQLSAALQIHVPPEISARRSIASQLHPFAESTYLHQVIERCSDGALYHYSDLVTALPHFEHAIGEEWRIHFHVPIFMEQYQVFQSTQKDILALLTSLQSDSCQHLEIETYTWDVLPSDMKLDLLTSIQREYEWVLSVLSPFSTTESIATKNF